ncbi:MAG: thioredoxin-like domain-containing protein [Bacteroidota bacterium]
MYKKLRQLLIIGLSLSSISAFGATPGYDIKVRIVGLQDTECYLGNHYGDKQYVKDTVKVDKDGWMNFKGSESLEGGIYLVILPNKTYFELLIDKEQRFTIETDTLDYVGHLKVTGSLENQLFNEHQKFLIEKGKQNQDLKTQLDESKGNKAKEEAIRKQMQAIDKEVKEYRIKLMNDHPKTFMAKLILTMQEPDVPDAPKDEKGNVLDSNFQFNYYKAHYLEFVDFGDERLLRTPILHNKVKVYTQQLTVPLPDSIIPAVDTIIIRSRANKEVFRYHVATLTNYYETSNIMGYDKVFVHLAETYYLTDEAYWADDTLKNKIRERVNKIKPNILGTPAHDLVMLDTNIRIKGNTIVPESMNYKRLYDIKARYTVLAFWDPTCSHCKVEIPELYHIYDSLKSKGVDLEVYSVGIESDPELWKKFIRDNKLNWINVTDPANQTKFRDYYDIYSTPVIYLLDDQKRIIAKRLDPGKVRDFIDREYKESSGKK